MSSESKTPIMNNMGGPNPRKAKPGAWIGLDWLTINFQIDWAESWETDHKDGSNLRKRLLDLVEAAQENGELIPVPGWDAVVHPGGGKIGSGTKGKYCKFKIERPDALFLIADSQSYKGDWPNVKIEISGERCLVYPGGAEAAIAAARSWLESLGAKIHKERVSRVDLCADFPEMRIGAFVKAYNANHWACRANDHHPHYSNGTSLYFGSGDIKLRIYDKLAEMRASALRGQPAKYEHMIQKRWGGEEPEAATRVEYQLRREWLKKHAVNDFDDLTKIMPGIVAYLTGCGNARWFRFLCEPVLKHTNRNNVLPEWATVQKAFSEIFKYPEMLLTIDPDRADVETLLRQAFGVLESAAANKGFKLDHKSAATKPKYEFPDYESFEQWICVMLRSVALQKKEWSFKKKPVSAFSEEYELFLKDWEIREDAKRK